MYAIVKYFLTCLTLFSPMVVCAQTAEDHPVFDLHFVVITKNGDAHRIASLEQLKKEVAILNTHFVTENRQAIVKFRFKSAAFYDEVQNSSCELVKLGDTTRPYDSDGWAALFNACDDPRVRDLNAINFYVYDSYNPKTGFSDTTSHGKVNANRPYVLIDWARLNHNDQSVEEHEMGHAFGLDHVCVPGARRSTSTNIMASAECGKGSGGRRDIGFNASQVKTILDHARQTKVRLKK